MREKLPSGVSYPTVSGGEVDTALGDDDEGKLILPYMLNADMSGEQRRQIAEKEMKGKGERVEGVHHVDITGYVTHDMEVEYDARQLTVYGIIAIIPTLILSAFPESMLPWGKWSLMVGIGMGLALACAIKAVRMVVTKSKLASLKRSNKNVSAYVSDIEKYVRNHE